MILLVNVQACAVRERCKVARNYTVQRKPTLPNYVFRVLDLTAALTPLRSPTSFFSFTTEVRWLTSSEDATTSSVELRENGGTA